MMLWLTLTVIIEIRTILYHYIAYRIFENKFINVHFNYLENLENQIKQDIHSQDFKQICINIHDLMCYIFNKIYIKHSFVM